MKTPGKLTTVKHHKSLINARKHSKTHSMDTCKHTGNQWLFVTAKTICVYCGPKKSKLKPSSVEFSVRQGRSTIVLSVNRTTNGTDIELKKEGSCAK